MKPKLSKRWPKRRVESFFDNWNPEMAYILGYFASDGTMYKNKRGSCYIAFTSADRVLIALVKKVMLVSNKIEVYQAKGNKNWKLRFTIQIGSKIIFNRLLALGFTSNKSLSLKYPPIPDELLGHFVRGYFDGDGCASFYYRRRPDRKNKRYNILNLRLTSGSKQFLESLHKKLIEVVKIEGGNLCSHSGAYTLSYSYNNVVKLYSFIYPVSGLPCLERKRTILETGIRNWGRSSMVRALPCRNAALRRNSRMRKFRDNGES